MRDSEGETFFYVAAKEKEKKYIFRLAGSSGRPVTFPLGPQNTDLESYSL